MEIERTPWNMNIHSAIPLSPTRRKSPGVRGLAMAKKEVTVEKIHNAEQLSSAISVRRDIAVRKAVWC
jgi:hypothetical protein